MAETLNDSSKKQEDWMNTRWRPMMGWMYMSICMFDFLVAPILWSLLQALNHGTVTSQWQPLTLQGAGLFHLAMGAVLGIAVYGRTQEKLNGIAGGELRIPMPAPINSVPASTTTTLSETITTDPTTPTLRPLGPVNVMPER